MKILKLIASCFLVAAFIWIFYVVQWYIAMVNFNNGVQYGISSCPEPDEYKTSLPYGDTQDTASWLTAESIVLAIRTSPITIKTPLNFTEQ